MSLADQQNRAKDARITFTPLRQGRYRCNWNGAVITHGAVHAARNRRWSELHPHVEMPAPAPKPLITTYVGPPPQPKPTLKEVVADSTGYIRCPNSSYGSLCGSYKFVGYAATGEYTCNSCSKPFLVVTAATQSAANQLREAEAINAYGDVNCPNCRGINTDAVHGNKPMEVTCEYCHQKFLAKPRTAV